jgi:hypothetical protein
MPDDVVQDLVGHELAHGVQFARGIRERKCSDGQAVYVLEDGSLFGDTDKMELDADTMIRSWGFDPDSVYRWAAAAGIP